jgi:DNA-directed RNA polymerase subunit L/DNA-directed RNA polymerase alpha subunit
MASNVFQSMKRIDNRTISFVMSPTDVAYANVLRRAVQTEVATLGFRADMTESGSTTDVKIFKNSTPMSNEMLADRIGLIPIVMPSGTGWDKEKTLFRLKVVNDTDEFRTVTASDFECLERVPDMEDLQRVPNTRYFHPDPVTLETCIIAVLKPMIEGQEPEEIHLEAYASLGKGREHTRFNPTSQCSYGYTRDPDPVKIKTMFDSWLQDQKKVDPKELDKDADRKAMLEREFRSLEIYRCYLQDADSEPFSFDFTIETLGTMDVKDIVYEALMAVASLTDKYSAIDTGDLPANIDVRPADALMKGFDFWFTGEDHTLGNLMTTWIDKNKVGQEEITFAGYKIPHTLRDEMLLRIGVKDGKEGVARLAIAEAAKACADMFRTWATQWHAEFGSATATAATATAAASASASKPVKPWQAHAETKSRAKK